VRAPRKYIYYLGREFPDDHSYLVILPGVSHAEVGRGWGVYVPCRKNFYFNT
jgi:hypothetical protein